MGTSHNCSVYEYVNGDSSLPVCVDTEGDNWDENWLNSLTEEDEPIDNPSGNEDEEELDIPPPLPKIQTYNEAIQSLEDIKIFLEHRGHL